MRGNLRTPSELQLPAIRQVEVVRPPIAHSHIRADTKHCTLLVPNDENAWGQSITDLMMKP